ncbi:UAP56-interacting factor isoform X2 [Ahaetulla prasina]|uniref:UAP56-interacting factor isoform X2 n=1 Tax=Ahaetulla prasina TaxID=499056 RepID=UPI002648046F|nr:UAP56-interacting factor isoform X2 [Ahaetulla prasina]
MSGFGVGAFSLQRGGGGGGSSISSGSGETLEKIDMSLDDIIKLNKREERKQNSPKMKRSLSQNGTRQFRMRRIKWGIQDYPGFGKNHLGRRKQVPGKRRAYGIKTGLAARKALGAHKGISPLNRSPLTEKNLQRNYSVLKRKMPIQRQPELQRKQGARFRRPALLNRRPSIQSLSTRIGNKLYQQKDTRQATFLFRRGLKVQAQVHPEGDHRNQGAKRTRPSLKPRLTSNLIPPFLLKKEPSEEKKIPKGVPLQFDINSVGKQTSMTLNERFGILKEQRTALAQNKGSRFVTVA